MKGLKIEHKLVYMDGRMAEERFVIIDDGVVWEILAKEKMLAIVEYVKKYPEKFK